mmetsp:Transcript_21717/g.47490  ORF Transcript_21717/g.47490 Transcript_21717/m.47490 type:complete len:240 (-) Transcript_21717:413-1132(-)
MVCPTRPDGGSPWGLTCCHAFLVVSYDHRSLNDALVVFPPKTYIVVSPMAHAQWPLRAGGDLPRASCRLHVRVFTSNQCKSLKQRPGALPPKMSTRSPMRTALCAQRGHGRPESELTSPAPCCSCIHVSRSSDSKTHVQRRVFTSNSQVSFRKVISPCRPPNMKRWSSTAVRVADCRCPGVWPSGTTWVHELPSSAFALSRIHKSFSSPLIPRPPKIYSQPERHAARCRNRACGDCSLT